MSTTQQFTERARRALENAQKLANHQNAKQVECQHLLIALLAEENSVAARAMAKCLPGYRQLYPMPDPESMPEPEEPMELHESARLAVETAADRATEMGHTYTGTEHLVLGIIASAGSDAATTLMEQGIDERAFTDAAKRVLNPYAPSPVPIQPKARRAQELAERGLEALNQPDSNEQQRLEAAKQALTEIAGLP